MSQVQPSRIPLALAAVALVGFVIGPVGAHFEILSSMAGFQIFGLGGLCAIAALIGSIVAAIRRGRATAKTALALSVPLAVVFVLLALPGGSVPRINDITTDSDDPPTFVRAGDLAHNAGRDMTYPGADFARQQREGYPDLAPLRLSQRPDDVFSQARFTAEATSGWRVTRIDTEARELEAVATSTVFRFPDDVIVQVRPDGDGSVVHVRSKSRYGRSDMGANAARIDTFFAALRRDMR